MRFFRFAMLCATAALAACASDGITTAPTSPVPAPAIPGGRSIDARLGATIGSPMAVLGTETVSMSVTLSSNLPEAVTSGVCALLVDARAVNSTSWIDVRPASTICTMQALLLPPGGTLTIGATADKAQLRAVAGGAGGAVVIRIRHTVDGATTTYALQSAELITTAP